jgi:hypothetical protein
MTSARDAGPWYREPWPWILASGPAIVVVAAIVTAYIAWRTADGVVADDYYKRGLAVNEELGRSQRAEALRINGRLTFDGTSAGDAVRLLLRSGEDATGDPAIHVRLVHPGRADFDREAMLAKRGVDGDGKAEYVGTWQPAQPLPAGSRALWSVIVEGRDWRLDADVGHADAQRKVAAPEATAAGVIMLPAVARHP